MTMENMIQSNEENTEVDDIQFLFNQCSSTDPLEGVSLKTHPDGTPPSREEFHRYASNLLTEADFCTYSPGNAVNKAANALRWTVNNNKFNRKKWRFGNVEL